ncbi:MAG TPA: GNAT family N-acetyltransferase [Candidatus Eremiobacteraceae bacterium]
MASSLQERIVSSVSAVCPTVLLDDNRAETLKSILGKSTVSRRIKQLEKLGSLKFRHLDDRVQAREHLPSFYEQHIRCRTLAGIRSQLLDQQSKVFFEALVDNLDPSNELRFAVLESNDRPIAYNFGFQLDGKFLYYTPTFDIEFFDVSPGDVLLRYLFVYARDSDIREFDFTVGDETYKSRYANHTDHNYAVLLYPRSTSGRISQFAHAAKEHLRLYPSAYRATRTAASAASESASRIVRVLRREGAVRGAARVAVAFLRSAIYARDEVLVLELKKKYLTPASQPLTFRVATLSDLADAAVRHPEYLGGNSLHDLRERIKKGHTPFVALDDGNIVHIAWLRVEERIVTSELGEDFALELGRPVGIIYDAWTPQLARGRGIYPAVVSLIAEYIELMGLEQWIYVLSGNVASRRGLEKAGMEVQYRMIRYTWFHALHRRVILKPTQNE